MFCRERIYPFRNVSEHLRFVEQYSVPTTERMPPLCKGGGEAGGDWGLAVKFSPIQQATCPMEMKK